MQQHLLFYRTVFRSQPPTLRENCQSASRGWVQLLRLRASLRRDGDGLCENSINECSKSSECRDSIPTKGGCDWWREYAIEVDFGLKIGCRLRFIRVHDFAANRELMGCALFFLCRCFERRKRSCSIATCLPFLSRIPEFDEERTTGNSHEVPKRRALSSVFRLVAVVPGLRERIIRIVIVTRYRSVVFAQIEFPVNQSVVLILFL